MLWPMYRETTRLRVATLHTKGNVLLLYGLSYISGLIFMAPNSLYILTISLSKWLMTNDKFIGKLAHWALIFQEYEFKVIHRPGITH
jgi:hypothetical protein